MEAHYQSLPWCLGILVGNLPAVIDGGGVWFCLSPAGSAGRSLRPPLRLCAGCSCPLLPAHPCGAAVLAAARVYALRSFRRRNVHLVCGHEFGVRHLGFQSHVLVGWFLISVGEKGKFVLMVEPICELIQERFESNRRLKTLEIRFASGLVGEL